MIEGPSVTGDSRETEPETPFLVPGYELNPLQPLNPGHPDNLVDHEKYYCDIGGHDTAFQRFVEVVGHPERGLGRTGGLVVVCGPKSSGKTSLVNRCVYRLKTAGLGRGATLHLFDLRTGIRRGQTVDERCRRVAELIMDEIRQLGPASVIPDPPPTTIESALMALGRARRVIGSGLDTFVVLVSPMEFDSYSREILQYRERFEPGVVCFLEYSTDRSVSHEYDVLRNPPIVLGLRYVRSAEAPHLVTQWPLPESIREAIDKQALSRLVKKVEEDGLMLSTTMLLSTLQTVFARRRLRSRSEQARLEPTKLKPVAYTELVESMNSVLLRSHRAVY